MTDTMTRKDLVHAVATTTGMTLAQSKTAVDTTLSNILGSLEDGRAVSIKGFGTFALKQRKARVLKGPIGQDHEVPAHRGVAFRPSSVMKERVK